MNRRLIYEDSSGYCRVITPFEGFHQPFESEIDAVGRLYLAAIPSICVFIVTFPEKLPSDLTFRDAWEVGDSCEPIKINFEKAICIHRGRLKEACDKKIEALNQELEKALENDNLPECVSIRATKKILRTIHEMNLTHCKTLHDLKYAVPKELHDCWVHYKI